MAGNQSNGEGSTSSSNRSSSHDDDRVIVSKEDLWKDALEKDVDGAVVQMVGMESPSHTVYSRVVSSDSVKVTIGTVVESMVDEGWRHVAKDILEKKEHVEIDSHPPASKLLELGAVWLLNETAYTKGKGTHAHRLGPKDEETVPNWKDMTLRVHYVPDRFHVANEVDWSKPCRGLLLGQMVQVSIDGTSPHVNVSDGLPDDKDGVIVYEDTDLGFAVLNKPGNMPVHATISNHKEDVISMYTEALKERKKDKKNQEKTHVSVPQGLYASLDTDTHGLLAVATKPVFATYMSAHGKANNRDSDASFTKKFKCLVCVKNPDNMALLEEFQLSGTPVIHWVDVKSPAPKRFVQHKPHNTNGRSEWQQCQLRITKVGHEKFRAACVRSVYKDSIDSTLANRLWGPESETPAEDLGVQYVMELELELLTARTHQIPGQLAAMGFPIVGDVVHGGGKCEFYAHKHGWNRLALQCSELSFMEPEAQETTDGKKELVPSERKCIFRLNNAWWSEFLDQYEFYHENTSI